MGRRRFDFFYIELCCALDQRLPRYALWLDLGEQCCDPEQLDRSALLAFVDEDLDRFLAHQGLRLAKHVRTRLRRKLARFDPNHPTPEEIFDRICAPVRA